MMRRGGVALARKKPANGSARGGIVSGSMEVDREDRLAQLTAEMAWVRRLAYALVRGAEADDVAQDAWLVAAERQPNDGRPLRPWLGKVVLNLVRMRSRADRRRQAREDATQELSERAPDSEDLVRRVELQRRLADEVLKLAEPSRSTVLLHYFEELTCAEIARRLSLPEGTVRRRLKTALDQLRTRFEADRERSGGLGALAPLAGLHATKTSVAAAPIGIIAMKKLVAVVIVFLIVIVAALRWHGRGTSAVATRGSAEPPRNAGTPGAQVTSPHTPAWFTFPGIPERRIAGHVVFAGKPFEGARIELRSMLTEMGAADVVATTSDATGAFDLGSRPAAAYDVIADAPGKVSAIAHVELTDPASTPDRLELRLRACDHSVAGTIYDASGGTVAGAHVRRQDLAGTESDRNGAYRLCVPFGNSELDYTADGYGGVTLTVSAQGEVRQDLVLVPEATVVVHAIRAADAQPVPDAIVRVVPQDFATDRPRQGFALTDADGRARVAGLVPGRYRIAAFSDALSSDGPVGVLAEVGKPAEVEIKLGARARIRGVVTSDHHPVAGASVEAVRKSPLAHSPAAISQADGSFVLERVPVGDVTFVAPPYRVVTPSHLAVDAAREIDHVEIEVGKLGSIHGRVTRLGRPIEGADVCCVPTIAGRNNRAMTDAAGRYDFDGVTAGTFDVTAQSDEAGAFMMPRKITLGDGEERDVDFELDMAATITGTVVDKTGAPVEGVHVVWIHEKTGDLGRSVTDRHGRYRCAAMTGGGRYHAAVFPTSAEQGPFPTADGKPYPTVALKDGTSVLNDVTIAIDAARLTISGHVTDTAGNPVPDAQIKALAMRGGDVPQFSPWIKVPLTFSDQDGAFTLTGVTSGMFAVQAHSSDGGEAIVPGVAAGATGVTIRVERPGAIDGKLVGFPSPPVVYARPTTGNFKLTAGLVDGDGYHVLGLRAGRYVIDAQNTFEGDAQIVEVKPGETAHVDLHARGRAAVDGTVVDFRSHKPLPGFACHAVLAVDGEQGTTNWDPATTVRSDAAGKVAIDPAPAGSVTVTCMPPSNRLSAPAADVSLAPGSRSAVQLLALEATQDQLATFGIDFSSSVTPPRISRVRANTPAAKAGLMPGDLVVAVDGVSVAGLNGGGVFGLIGDRPAGSKVTVTVLHGTDTKTVTGEVQPWGP
jgi:RNA polymerase sigma factor (sigma-70 family)